MKIKYKRNADLGRDTNTQLKGGKKMNRIGIKLGILLVMLIAMVGSANAANCGAGTGNACQCGDTVIGDFTFTTDLACTNPAQNGLIIGASGITIDGAGHKITGNVSHATCTGSQTSPCETHSGIVNVNGSCNNVVVKNLEIENFCTGVVIGTGSVTVEYMNVTDCKIHDCGKYASTHGIHLVGANYCNMSKNEIYNIDGQGIPAGCGGGGNGIFMHGGQAGLIHGDYNTVTCNYVHNTNKSGIFSKYQCRYCDVSYNNASDNPEGGIVPMCKKSNDWTIEYNNMSNNGRFGLKMQASDNTLRYNTILNNGWYGIWIVTEDSPMPSHGTNNDVLNNTLCGNSFGDIKVTNSDGSNTADSNTCDASDIGGCDWSCDDLASVYYDYDGDGLYSPTSCPCSNGELCVGSCCNPGLFNSSGVTQHCAGGVCQLSPGDDDCDCGDLPEPHYVLNWDTYPYSTWENINWSGPAAMEMMINHYTTAPSQSELDVYGRDHNHNCQAPDFPYVDRYGMRATLNAHLYPAFAHYGNHITTDVENALHYICWWQSLGPGAVPAYQDYSNWMVVRGIHTDINPRDGSYYSPYGYTIYGYWINDPNPAGIGENSYKCVNQFTENYYQSMLGQCDVTDGYWVSICEPPEVDAEITLANSPARLAKAITPVMAEKMLMLHDVKQIALEKVVKDDDLLKIVEAAIDGVNEQLAPYDAEFADVFAETVAGEPMLVSSDNGDYYLVPFNVPVEVKQINKVPVAIEKVKMSGLKNLERVKRVADEIDIKPIPIKPIKLERTLVTVLVDAADGSFKEASWVDDPVKYLPVSKVDALKLALGELLDDRHIVVRKDARDLNVLTQKPTIELVYRDASPYYPDWKITIGDKVFYVSQDGTVS